MDYLFTLIVLLLSASLGAKNLLESTPLCETTSCINKKLQNINDNVVKLEICGDFYFDESILVYSGVSLSSCINGASIKVLEDFIPFSKGYENAIIKLRRPEGKDLVHHYSDIEINGISIQGNAALGKHTMGIVITPMGWDYTGRFYLNNLKLINNNISNLDSNGIVVGNPNNNYFNDRFYFQDVIVENNRVEDLTASGAGIIIVDESIPELTYSELGYLNRYRIDRISARKNTVKNVFSDAENRLHGAGFGLIVDGAKHVVIAENTVGEYAEEGIRVYDSNWVKIQDNDLLPSYPLVKGNEFNANGIKLNRVANAEINNNVVNDSSGPGIELYGTAKVKVYNNSISQNISHGMRVESYLVLDNPLCNDNVSNKQSLCLFRNQWIEIFNNKIKKVCGCNINIVSDFNYNDSIEMDYEGSLINLKSLSNREYSSLTSCTPCP